MRGVHRLTFEEPYRLWARLVLHFWALEAEKDNYGNASEPDPVGYLQRAYEHTKKATSEPNEWQGTTTVSGAILGFDRQSPPHPILYVTQLGDSQVLVLRPKGREIIFKTTEQWHWFDCPRQLGTNSPDTPQGNAVMDRIELEEDDVVLAMSDGVVDNLWDHEVVENVVESMRRWQAGDIPVEKGKEPGERSYSDRMKFVAQELVKAARVIAEDPFAESPYMEKAVEEGLSIEGGKFTIPYCHSIRNLMALEQASWTTSVWSSPNVNGAKCDYCQNTDAL